MTTQEKIGIMQAYVDGKQIQVKNDEGKWVDWSEERHREPNWNWETGNYRIKPEFTYRPYENTEEMIADFKERFGADVPDYAMPLIWIFRKDDETRRLVVSFADKDIATMGGFITLDYFFDCYTYLDGTPVGKFVEQMRMIDADPLSKSLYFTLREMATGKAERRYKKLCKNLMDLVDSQPTIDAEPVRHGHWIDTADKIDARFHRHQYFCSVCGAPMSRYVGGVGDWWDMSKTKYCSSCGAKMDEVE